jgi:DNA polymerase-3 subunit epsilon
MSTLSRSATSSSSVVAWARQVMADPATVFLDTETTGLDANAEIIDIAVVDVAGRVLLDTLVRPRRPIPSASSMVHGLYDDDVTAAPGWDIVYERLLPIMDERRVVIYNAAYDTRILRQCCGALRLAEPQFRGECAMRKYAEFAGMRERSGYRWHKLDAAARRFGLPPGGHRALADAETCRRVVRGMAGTAGA